MLEMEPTEEEIFERLKGKPVPADIAKRNLDAVREALKVLGGKAFGANIVDYLCRNRLDMLRSFGGDKKRLRYCVNGLLSARVNSTYFEKKVYKDNGSTKTEWMLADMYDENINILSDGSNVNKGTYENLSFSEGEDTEKEIEEDLNGNLSDTNANHMNSNDEENLTPNTRRRRSSRQAQNVLRGKTRSSSRFSPDVKREDDQRKRRGSKGSEDEDCYDNIQSIAEAAFVENRDKDRNAIDDIDEFDNSEGDFQSTGDTPLTYRGMIKVALENMGGHGTFESISKYIGVRFKDQLVNKAETWKHSIAGCLSVYFARKEEKDSSGKVIWTLEEPPKPKRRGRKRDRDDIMSMNAERETFTKETRSSTAKKRKEEMVLISIEQLEALEEENECLKLLNVKKREEKESASYQDTEPSRCSCCQERKELSMMLNPCGHLFCGSIFCEASTTKNCYICKAEVLQRLPHHKNRNSKSLKGIFDSLANAVMTSMMISSGVQDMNLGNNSVITSTPSTSTTTLVM